MENNPFPEVEALPPLRFSNTFSPVLLASASPRRASILRALGIPLRVKPMQTEEVQTADPVETVTQNALSKIRAARTALGSADFLLSADTIVFHRGKILGKPRDEEDAVRMLCSFSNQTQLVFTGISILPPHAEEPFTGVAASSVRFRPVDETLARDYLAQAKTLDRAGAYDINVYGDRLIASYAGSYTNIMGLPAGLVHRYFLPFSVTPFP